MTTVVIYSTQAVNLPSIRMRLLEPLLALGASVRVVLGSGWDRDGRYFIDQNAWCDADVIIAHRNFPTAETIPIIRKIATSGKRLVYETDDAFQLLLDSHPKAFHKASGIFIDECAALAATVVVATDELSKLYRGCRQVVVLKNRLSQRIWRPTPETLELADNRCLRIALVGGMDHIQEFALLQPVVRRLHSMRAIEWACYGEGAIRAIEAMGVTPVVSIPSNFNYPSHPERLRALKAKLALCPLTDTEFNRCKSDVKFLEFGFLGIPVIASGLPGYTDEIQDGVNGYLVNTADDWLPITEKILNNLDDLGPVGDAARSHVTQNRMTNTPGYDYEVLFAHG